MANGKNLIQRFPTLAVGLAMVLLATLLLGVHTLAVNAKEKSAAPQPGASASQTTPSEDDSSFPPNCCAGSYFDDVGDGGSYGGASCCG